MSDAPIPLLEPSLEGKTREYLEACVASNFVSSVGPFVERFERAFADYVGARFAVPCASGTAALHVAMRLLDLAPEDEVCVSDLTFIASANPIKYERATPVLVDAEPETWNLDPALVAAELERRARTGRRQPRAVVAVHILGQPCQIELLAAVCEKHGVVLVEDAAEALGARYVGGRYDGRQVGTIGRMGCYSFNGNKVITTGGGGMLTTDDPALAERARHLTTQARLPGSEYRHDEVGYNYRMTNLAAALGVAQLEQLPAFLRRKREIAERYDAAFESRAGLLLPPRMRWCEASRWLYSLRVEPARFGRSREALAAQLGRAGIQSRPIWTPLHAMPMYRDAERLGGGVAETLFAEALSLPSSVQLSEADQDRVIAGVLGNA